MAEGRGSISSIRPNAKSLKTMKGAALNESVSNRPTPTVVFDQNYLETIQVPLPIKNRASNQGKFKKTNLMNP